MDISVLYNLRAEISLLVAIIVVLVADIAIKRPRYRLLQGLACVYSCFKSYRSPNQTTFP